MKLIKEINRDNPVLSKTYVQINEGETYLQKLLFYTSDTEGELFIPEGIEDIETYCFAGRNYHIYHFPKSLKELGEGLFSAEYSLRPWFTVKIIFDGTSEEFINLGQGKAEEVCESDGYDHYPYYSGGSRWVTVYHTFDKDTESIEVECLGDGVTLLYGYKNRKGCEPPKIKQ